MPKLIKLLVFTFLINTVAFAQANLNDSFDKLLPTEFRPDGPGGVVLVAKNGQSIYKKAFGMANLELAVPMTDSMVLYIASNTKQFTAIAVLQLLEQGKLRLEDTLGQFIQNCPHPVSGISIRHLLTQTSGIKSNDEKEISKKFVDQRTHQPLPLSFSPGSRWEYHNTNYTLLGKVIEKTSQQTYSDYLQHHLFKPAGMSETWVDREFDLLKNRASGYAVKGTDLQKVQLSDRIGASGGIQSTVDDLLKWNQALKSGKLLKPETLQLAFTAPRLTDGRTSPYGMGWYVEELQGSVALRHGGLLPGYASETLYLPQEDVYVVVLLNVENGKIDSRVWARLLAGLAMGKPYRFEKVAIDPPALEKFVGLYENKFGELVNITEQNGQLVFQRPNGGPNNLNYAGDDDFFFEQNFLRVKFIKNAQKQIKSLKFSRVDIGVTEWFFTGKPVLKLAPQKIAEPLLKHYEGKYHLPGQDSLVVSREGVNLYCQIGKQERHLLAAEDDTHFFGLKENLRLEFITEPTTRKVELSLLWKEQRKQYTKL